MPAEPHRPAPAPRLAENTAGSTTTGVWVPGTGTESGHGYYRVGVDWGKPRRNGDRGDDRLSLSRLGSQAHVFLSQSSTSGSMQEAGGEDLVRRVLLVASFIVSMLGGLLLRTSNCHTSKPIRALQASKSPLFDRAVPGERFQRPKSPQSQ